jgi:hypothetical protein
MTDQILQLGGSGYRCGLSPYATRRDRKETRRNSSSPPMQGQLPTVLMIDGTYLPHSSAADAVVSKSAFEGVATSCSQSPEVTERSVSGVLSA